MRLWCDIIYYFIFLWVYDPDFLSLSTAIFTMRGMLMDLLCHYGFCYFIFVVIKINFSIANTPAHIVLFAYNLIQHRRKSNEEKRKRFSILTITETWSLLMMWFFCMIFFYFESNGLTSFRNGIFSYRVCFDVFCVYTLIFGWCVYWNLYYLYLQNAQFR